MSRLTYTARYIPLGKGFITGVNRYEIFGMFDGTTGCVMEFHGTRIAQVVGGKGCAGRGQYADHSQKQGKFLHHRIHPFFYFFFSWFFLSCSICLMLLSGVGRSSGMVPPNDSIALRTVYPTSK